MTTSLNSLSVIPTTNTDTIHNNSHSAQTPLTLATMLYVLPATHHISTPTSSRNMKLTRTSSRLFEKKPKSLKASKAKKTPASSRGPSRNPSTESSAASTPFSSRPVSRRPSLSDSLRPSLAGSRCPSLSGSTRSNRASLSESHNNFPGMNPLDDGNNFTGAASTGSPRNNFTGAAPKGSARNNFMGVDRKLRNGFAAMNPGSFRNNFPGDN